MVRHAEYSDLKESGRPQKHSLPQTFSCIAISSFSLSPEVSQRNQNSSTPMCVVETRSHKSHKDHSSFSFPERFCPIMGGKSAPQRSQMESEQRSYATFPPLQPVAISSCVCPFTFRHSRPFLIKPKHENRCSSQVFGSSFLKAVCHVK